MRHCDGEESKSAVKNRISGNREILFFDIWNTERRKEKMDMDRILDRGRMTDEGKCTGGMDGNQERIFGEREIEGYRRHLIQEERAPATISKYLHDIRLFAHCRAGTEDLSEVGEGAGT